MWAVFNFGFFSAVQRKELPEGDNRSLQIRVRDPKHLDIMRERYMGDQLGPTVVYPSSDYQARAFCTPEAWARAQYAIALDVDYDNFKSSITEDDDLHDAAMGVWSALAQQYGTNYNFSTSKSGSGYGKNRKAGSRSYYHGGSVFGQIEDVDQDWDDFPVQGAGTINWSYSSPTGDTSIVGELTDDVDSSIEEIIEKYAPLVLPDNMPGMLNETDLEEWCDIKQGDLVLFMKSNLKWRKYRGNASEDHYVMIPKKMIGEFEEEFNIWLSDRLDQEHV